jgi:hypothetical protein
LLFLNHAIQDFSSAFAATPNDRKSGADQ